MNSRILEEFERIVKEDEKKREGSKKFVGAYTDTDSRIAFIAYNLEKFERRN